MTFPERVQGLTQDGLLPKVADNVLRSNALVFRLLGNAKNWKGETLKKPIKYQSSGTFTSFSGLDTFTAALTTTTVRMAYNVSAVRIPAAIGGLEAAVNRISETQVTDLVVEELQEKEQELMDGMGSIVYGTGTGNGGKDPLGLGAIVDDGTDVATIGGLARSAYPVLNATRTASGGTLSLAKMATLHSAIEDGTIDSSPTLGLANPTIFDLYESLLTPSVRQDYSMLGYYDLGLTGGAKRPAEGLKGMAGFTALSYRGIPFVKDRKATSQNLFFINEFKLDWYGLDCSVLGYKSITPASSTIEGIYGDYPTSKFTGLAWSGWQIPPGTFGAVADIILAGQMVSWEPRRHGRLTGITSV